MEYANKPRDFFLHISSFVALFFIAIAAITLHFTLIDYKFPDPLSNYFTDPYSGPVRFAIASLIILTPIAAYFMRTIHKEARQTPERAKLGVRRWLTYITLFIAGATVTGDLIVLLNSYLGGSLPTAFLLKAVVLLLVAGIGFGYFYLDLKGYWLSNARDSRYAGIGLLVAVAASVVLGFMTLGSPSVQRDIRLDTERTAALMSIQSLVVQYWQQNEKLPLTLGELENPLYGVQMPLDPETKESYAYEVTGDLSFKLCATFARESAEEKLGEYYALMPGIKHGNEWTHMAGTVCFNREIDTDLIKPITTPTTLPLKEVPVN